MANPYGSNNKSNLKPGGQTKQNVAIVNPNALQIVSSNLPDGLDQSIQQPYVQNGLTYLSNNKNVMQRDPAGNVVLATENVIIKSGPRAGQRMTPRYLQNLIIEPSIEQITNSSFVEVTNTQFNYFKFPAKAKSSGDSFSFDNLDLDVDVTIDSEDTTGKFGGRYVTNIEYAQIKGVDGYPLTWKRIPIGVWRKHSVASGYPAPDGGRWFFKTKRNGDQAADWQKQWASDKDDANYYSWQELPFNKVLKGPDQLDTNAYTVTDDMLSALKEAGKTIRFKISISCYITGLGSGWETDGTNYYGADCKFGLMLRAKRGYWSSKTDISPGGQQVYSTEIAPYIIKNRQIHSTGTTETSKGDQGYENLSIDYIVDLNGLRAFAQWRVYICAQYCSYYLADNIIWDIEIIDDPGIGNYGIQDQSQL